MFMKRAVVCTIQQHSAGIPPIINNCNHSSATICLHSFHFSTKWRLVPCFLTQRVYRGRYSTVLMETIWLHSICSVCFFPNFSTFNSEIVYIFGMKEWIGWGITTVNGGPFHKSHNASDKCLTAYHFATEMCTRVYISVPKWYIVKYETIGFHFRAADFSEL